MNNTELNKTEHNIIERQNETQLHLDPEENWFLEYTNELLSLLSFKKEKIRTWEKWWVEMTEILANFNWEDIWDVLESLKITNRTYDLFKKVILFTFEKVYNEQKWYSVNLYLQDFENENFIQDIEELEEQFQIDNSKITFEILETNYWFLNKRVLNNLKALKEKWFKIAVDDFIPNLDDENKSYEIVEILLKNEIIPEYIKIDWQYLQSILKGEINKDGITIATDDYYEPTQ